jgi:enterochelin esterase-like enzyme
VTKHGNPRLRAALVELAWRHEDEYRFIPVNSRALSLALTNNGVDHIFEEYNGDHRNRLWGRNGRLYREVMPYLWQSLDHLNRRQ